LDLIPFGFDFGARAGRADINAVGVLAANARFGEDKAHAGNRFNRPTMQETSGMIYRFTSDESLIYHLQAV
jgi:hypothetical protein